MDDLCGPARIRLDGPRGLIAAVPSVLGFHPTDSLTMMCFTGERSTLGPVARVDLPRGRDPRLVRFLTGTALTHADQVAILCYPRRRYRPAILDDLQTELRRAGITVLTVLVVHGGRAWPTPVPGPLRLVDSLPVPGPDDPTVRDLAAASVLEGRVVLTDRDQLRASIAGPRGRRRREVERAISTVTRGRTRPLPEPPDRNPDGPAFAGDEDVPPLPERLHRVIDWALAQVGETGAVDAELAAELAVACLQTPIRDGVLIRALLERDQTWLAMLIACAAWTPDDLAAGICAVLATLAYRQGDGALAQVSLDRCLLAEPGNTFAPLLLTALSAGLPPEILDGMLVPMSEWDGPDAFGIRPDQLRHGTGRPHPGRREGGDGAVAWTG